MICDPNTLSQRSSCIRCLTDAQLTIIKTALLCRWAQLASPVTPPVPVIDADVLAWAARVVANGGAVPSDATLTAMSTYVTARKAAGTWTKSLALNIIAPDSLIAAITPLVVGGNDPWTNAGFIAGDLTVNGLKGDGIAKNLLIGLNPSLTAGISASSSSITIYNTTSSNGAEVEAGCYDGVNSAFQFGVSLGGNALSDDYFNGGSARLSVANPLWTGYTCSTRYALANWDIYKANSVTPHAALTASATLSGIAPPNTAMRAFSSTTAAPASGFSTKRLSLVEIAQGFTQAESLSNFNAIQALRVAFGGGFI